ncbi:hypothetical protein Mal48_46300 [Thalassoglobus polymorphus]|uniref:Uncharacterized protein n=1 Tax=Thalassoglobus polymorphus TaxID=2527994 RepID=A0A517QUQ8_9PLAN|nr:hypothetical protein Mal48_46300 [Thalassoglobus polymorphus]
MGAGDRTTDAGNVEEVVVVVVVDESSEEGNPVDEPGSFETFRGKDVASESRKDADMKSLTRVRTNCIIKSIQSASAQV